jgi:hypothetical protein
MMGDRAAAERAHAQSRLAPARPARPPPSFGPGYFPVSSRAPERHQVTQDSPRSSLAVGQRTPRGTLDGSTEGSRVVRADASWRVPLPPPGAAAARVSRSRCSTSAASSTRRSRLGRR